MYSDYWIFIFGIDVKMGVFIIINVNFIFGIVVIFVIIGNYVIICFL